MSETNLHHYSSKELKDILDSELKSQTPDYNKISLISTILSSRDSLQDNPALQTSTPVFTKSSTETTNSSVQKKPDLITRLKGNLSSKEFKIFFAVCILGAFYIGSWFYRLANMSGDIYDQKLLGRIFFGTFAFTTVITYLLCYLFYRNYKSSSNFLRSNFLKVLIILGISTILDLSLLALDITDWVKSTHEELLALIVAASIFLKMYALTRFFSIKDDTENLFVKRSAGILSRLGDYQFLVYIFSGILLLVLSISSYLVTLYDIDSTTFFYGFLLPFTVTFIAALLTASYFNLNYKIWERNSAIVKFLFPLFTLAISFLAVPVAVVFFLTHAFFLFRKIFELELFNNPTFVLSQIYVGITIATLLAYFIIKILKPFVLSDTFNKVLKFTLLFHLLYAVVGIIFAFTGMLIRINSAGFTDNRILALTGLFIEFSFLTFTLFKLTSFNEKRLSIPEDARRYNSVFKFLYIIPVLFLALNWFIVGVIKFDKNNIKSILKESKNIDDFRINKYYRNDSLKDEVYNGDYTISVIDKELNSVNRYSDPKKGTPILNFYLQDSSNIAQMFIIINRGEYELLSDYNLNSEVKAFFEKHKNLADQQGCREDFYNLVNPNGSSSLQIRQLAQTWSPYNFIQLPYEGSDYLVNSNHSNFWNYCLDQSSNSYDSYR